MKQQVLIIKVKYDEKNQHCPSSWSWPSLLKCEYSCVEILNSGAIEDVVGEEKTTIDFPHYATDLFRIRNNTTL